MKISKFLGLILVLVCFSGYAVEKDATERRKPADMAMMDNEKLDILIKRIDPEVEGTLGYWQLIYEQTQVYVITDDKADRMRIMSPIVGTEKLDKASLYRLLQANYDSALDARYAVANDTLWSAFIHPLSTLTERDFFSGLAQTIIAANTYGTTYTSGALIFQGGDSEAKQKQYYDEILKKGLSI